MKYPSQIFYMIDIACNEKCIKCSHWTYKSVKNIDIECVIKFVNSIKSANELCIVGGEPLIYKKDIEHLIKSILNNIRVVMITNGVMANCDFLEFIANKNVHIVFSIDTLDRIFWKLVRGKDTYDIVMDNFNIARKILNPTQLSVQSVLSKETQTHIAEVGEMCKKYGIFHSIQNYIDDFNGKWTKCEYTATDSPIKYTCQAYKQNLSIMPNGDVKTCFQQEKIDGCSHPIGHINENPNKILEKVYTKFVIEKMKKCDLPCKVLKCNQ